MKTQYFGIEIELTGITRESAAKVIAEYFGTTAEYIGGTYRRYEVKDRQERIWKVMRDASIRTEKKSNGIKISAGAEYSVEIVSPKCKYKDIETIQEIIRIIRKNNGFENSSCGIHYQK